MLKGETMKAEYLYWVIAGLLFLSAILSRQDTKTQRLQAYYYGESIGQLKSILRTDSIQQITYEIPTEYLKGME